MEISEVASNYDVKSSLSVVLYCIVNLGYIKHHDENLKKNLKKDKLNNRSLVVRGKNTVIESEKRQFSKR